MKPAALPAGCNDCLPFLSFLHKNNLIKLLQWGQACSVVCTDASTGALHCIGFEILQTFPDLVQKCWRGDRVCIIYILESTYHVYISQSLL